MTQSAEVAYWRDLEVNAHLPEVQEVIREEIQSGTIRVCSNGDGRIRIVPIGMPEVAEPLELDAPPAESPDEASPSEREPLRGRIARH